MNWRHKSLWVQLQRVINRYVHIAGIDEVGRGPLAGPVIAAAVVLPRKHSITGLADSKTIPPKKREQLALSIRNQASAWALGFATVKEIDQLNILQASLLAMRRAVLALPAVPEFAYVDGHIRPNLPCPCETVIRGDASVQCISAASIVAKVARDILMLRYDRRYPGYGFSSNRGYPTSAHREALRQHGVTPIHRRSFAPVRTVLERASTRYCSSLSA